MGMEPSDPLMHPTSQPSLPFYRKELRAQICHTEDSGDLASSHPEVARERTSV